MWVCHVSKTTSSLIYCKILKEENLEKLRGENSVYFKLEILNDSCRFRLSKKELVQHQIPRRNPGQLLDRYVCLHSLKLTKRNFMRLEKSNT